MVDYTVGSSPRGFFSIISKRPTKRKCIFWGGRGGGNTSMKIKISKIDAATLLLASSSKSERSLPV